MELGVVDSEEALLQRHDGEETMAPQDFIFGVRCPRLACHTYDGEKRREIFQILTRKRQKKHCNITKKIVESGLSNKNGQTVRQGTEMKCGELLQGKDRQRYEEYDTDGEELVPLNN